MTNIFRLPNPNAWKCTVRHLAKGHGLLQIALSNESADYEASQLEFTHVSYFAGWTVWRGVDFRIGTDSEYATFIRQTTSKYQTLSNNEILHIHPFNTTHLYLCETEDGSISRIASTHISPALAFAFPSSKVAWVVVLEWVGIMQSQARHDMQAQSEIPGRFLLGVHRLESKGFYRIFGREESRPYYNIRAVRSFSPPKNIHNYNN